MTGVLVLCELLFQKALFSDWDKADFLREPGAYADIFEDKNENIYSEEYWILFYFFEREFRPPEHPQPLLGWVGNFDRNTLAHFDMDKVQGRIPVLLFGDSFSYCVGADCFQDILNADSAFASKYYLLNYGVGGYGVDQIYLLAREVIPLYNDPIVIFGLMTRDMDRNILPFRTGQKPYFKKEGDELLLSGVPIEPKASYYVEDHMPDIDSYLYRFVRNTFRNFIPEDDPRTIEVKEKITEVNDGIMKKTRDLLQGSGHPFRYLVFSPVFRSEGEWREILIRDFMEENELPYIFTKDLFEADSNYGVKEIRFFEQENGHPTTYQNQLISREIWKCLMDSVYASVVDSLNTEKYLEVRNTYKIGHLDYYKRKIRRDVAWLNSIAEKAKERGLSTDSMITLDAIWLKGMDEKAREMGISLDSMIRLEAELQLKREINH